MNILYDVQYCSIRWHPRDHDTLPQFFLAFCFDMTIYFCQLRSSHVGRSGLLLPIFAKSVAIDTVESARRHMKLRLPPFPRLIMSDSPVFPLDLPSATMT
jgi:hypothetical protein